MIYMALLEHPHMSISEIARETGYHRPAVYRALDGLIADGYIERSKVSGKRYFYHVTHPDILRAKLRDLTELSERLIPEIEALYERSHDAPVLRVEEGISGIQRIHTDMIESLTHGDVYYCYSSSREG
jgi:sugar-specific transcriptional regulator TrmB